MFVLGIRVGLPRWSSSRQKSYGAWVQSADKTKLIKCVVCELSAGGGCVTLSGPIDIPEEFTVALTKDGTAHRQCRVIWKSNKAIGVRFL